MNLSAQHIAQAFLFYSRRYKSTREARMVDVEGAVRDFEQLQPAAGDEPAAVLFAFARHPKAFPGAMREFPSFLAMNAAQACGLRLNATAKELGSLVTDIVFGAVNYEDVRAWFAERVERL